MKFTAEIERLVRPDWRFFCADYEGLKRFIKERTQHARKWSFADESEFVHMLDSELAKVVKYRDAKLGEMEKHLQIIADSIGSRADVMSETEAVTQDLSDLSVFCTVNGRAVTRAVGKHDRSTSSSLGMLYKARVDESLAQKQLDPLFYSLSAIYERLRPPTTEPKGEINRDAFVRKTVKYWVHPDNVAAVKCLVLRHLPIYVFGNPKRVDPAISSVYLDNSSFELYSGRLDKTPGAIALRLRWYGSNDPSDVFVEMKTHRDGWTGEESVKERFQIKEEQAADLLQGRFSVEEMKQKMLKDGASERKVEQVVGLGERVVTAINEKHLVPFVRTAYNRVAFQKPDTAAVRISLDTELCMILERDKTGNGWRRTDKDIPETEIIRFPYAVLEVKLQTEIGQAAPQWVQDIVDGPLVEAVPKFSKFIHGSHELFKTQVPSAPYWTTQMGVDIRRPTPRLVVAEVACAANGGARKESSSPALSDSLVSPLPEGSQQQLSGAVTLAQSTGGSVGFYAINSNETEMLNASLLESGGLKSSTAQRRGGYGAIPQQRAVEQKPQQKKKITLPVRIEPKVFFANERTFLSWLHYSIFLGSSATALLGLGKGKTRILGIIVSVLSLLIAVYALFRHQLRCKQIRNREPVRYDDRIGPIMLVAIVAGVTVCSIVLTNINL
eukprot:m51a1_g385 hypothetical protein (669) ;mRNA; r:679435-682536